VAVHRAKLRLVIWAVLLVLMTLVAYIPAMRGGYVWDDDAHVLANTALRDTNGLRRIWGALWADETYYPITTQYYPMVFTSFWVEYHLWGLHPLGYHVSNVLLHALNAVLLWFVLRRLSVPGAWLAAAIFALHPVHVESVAWITERKNVLSALFYLSAMLAYLRFSLPGDTAVSGHTGQGHAVPWRFYVLAVMLYLLALLSKTVTCSLPAALLLLIWWKRDRLGWRDIVPLLPLFAVGAALGLATAWMERTQVGAMGEEWSLSFIGRCLVAGRVLWFYTGKLIWPHELIFIYPRWLIDVASWWQWLFPLTALAVMALLWLRRRQMGKGPLVAVLLFAGTLTPALGFFNVYPMLFSYVADHFQYLASVGLIALFAAAVVRASALLGSRRTVVGGAVCAVLLATLGSLVWNRGGAYKDAETLWRDTIDRNPNAWIAHLNLGMILDARGRVDLAMAHYKKVLHLKRDYPDAHNLLGAALVEKGRAAEANPHFVKALETWPGYAEAYNNFGKALFQLGKFDQAVDRHATAVRLRPDFPEARRDLAVALIKCGNVKEAIGQLNEALRLEPNHVQARSNLGSLLARQGHIEQAMDHFRAAVRLAPDYAPARSNLATALVLQNRYPEAIDHLNHAVRLRPDAPGPFNALARILATHADANLRDPDRAITLAQRACELTGGKAPALLDTLAAAYASAGRFGDAVATARRAIALASSAGLSDLTGRIRQRLQQYKAKHPPYAPATRPVPGLRVGPRRKKESGAGQGDPPR